MYYILSLLFIVAATGRPDSLRAKTSVGIKEKITSLAKKKVKAKCQACKVDIQCKWIAPALAEKKARSVQSLRFTRPGLPTGYVTVKVISGKGGAVTNANAQLYVSVQQKIAVAKVTIDRGEKIRKKDILWQWKFISKLSKQPVSNIKITNHKMAARLIHQGKIIYASDLAETSSIQAGDHVMMIYNKNGMDINFNCIARESKHVGQTIRLYSKQTGRMYMGKIENEHKIIWQQTL